VSGLALFGGEALFLETCLAATFVAVPEYEEQYYNKSASKFRNVEKERLTKHCQTHNDVCACG
jgi:hypothetical protein